MYHVPGPRGISPGYVLPYSLIHESAPKLHISLVISKTSLLFGNRVLSRSGSKVHFKTLRSTMAHVALNSDAHSTARRQIFFRNLSPL